MIVPKGTYGLPVNEKPSEDWHYIIYEQKKWMYGTVWKYVQI